MAVATAEAFKAATAKEDPSDAADAAVTDSVPSAGAASCSVSSSLASSSSTLVEISIRYD